MYRWLVHEVSNKIRIKILSLVVYLLKEGKVSDNGKRKLSLQGDALFEGIGELLCKQDIDRDLIVLLLKLGISVDRTSHLKCDIYTDFGKVLTVFHIVQFQPRPVKLEVAIKVGLVVIAVNSLFKKCLKIFYEYIKFRRSHKVYLRYP